MYQHHFPIAITVQPNLHYTARLLSDGTLALIPTHINIFTQHAQFDFRAAHRAMSFDSHPVGREVLH